MVITGSHSGTGETGRLRIDPKPLVVVEIEVEQDAVQIRVRKGLVLPRKAPDWPHSRITHSSTAVPMCQLD